MEKGQHSILPRIIIISIVILLFLSVKVFSSYFLQNQTGFEFLLKKFILSILIGIACLTAIWLLHLLLKNLHRQNKLPNWLHRISENGLYSALIQNPLQWIQSHSQFLSFRLVVRGLIIVCLVQILFKLSPMNSIEGIFYGLDQLVQKRQLLSPVDKTQTDNSPVVEFRLFSSDNNFSLYLQNVLKIVTDLKTVGVKAVSVDFRDPFLADKKDLDIVNKLERTGIVVFAQESGKTFGLLNVSDGRQKMTKAYYTLGSLEKDGPFIHRIQPVFYMPLSDGSWVPRELDVSLELLKKYHGYPDTLRPYYDGKNLVLGNDRFPINSNNEILTRGSGFWHGPQIGAFYGKGIGEKEDLKYAGFHNYSDNRRIENNSLLEIADQLKGKIVFINWYNRSNTRDMSINRYCDVIKNLVNAKFIVEYNYWYYAITLLCLLLAGWLAIQLRPIYAYGVTFALAFILLAGGYWLYHSQNIFLHITYPFAAMILAAFFFSIGKLKWEKGIPPLYNVIFEDSQQIVSPALEYRLPTKKTINPQMEFEPRFMLTRKRIVLATPLAVSALIITILTSIAFTSLWYRTNVASNETVVYVPTLPTVEVRGYIQSSPNVNN
jgi:hypothetical protein